MQQRLDSKIDFNTITTKEDLRSLSEEEVSFIKSEGLKHNAYLRNSFSNEMLKELLAARAKEIAYIGSKYRDLNQTAKELLAVTIVFPNDESFIRCLLSKKITYNQLFSYAKAISSIKKVTLLANRLEVDDTIKITNQKINNLCSLVRMYFGSRDYNLIIAKINEIVVFKKDLYKKLEQEQFTPTPKTR